MSESIKASALEQSKTTYDKQNTKENDPCFWREEKGADCHCTENQKHESDILGLFIYVKTLFFTEIVIHFLHPIHSMKKNRKVCGIVVY